MNKIELFLSDNSFIIPNVDSLSKKIFQDMIKGLEGEESDQPMIVTRNEIPVTDPADKKIIVIDAGGTNFRSCLVTFNKDGKAKISDLRKTRMPGTDRTLSKKEFYGEIADNISYLKDKASKIGFCFSYALKSLPNGDAEILAFSKEVKADEAIGSRVGLELKNALEHKGWTLIPSVNILNDTTAALLSGVTVSRGKNYDSFAGFILGTGINNAYYDQSFESVIVCECGMFSDIERSIFDSAVDKESAKPGASPLEKMCSGVYLGKIIQKIITTACMKSGYSEEKLFSEEFTIRFQQFIKTHTIELSDLSPVLENPAKVFEENPIYKLCCTETKSDKENFLFICKKVIERAAAIVTSVLTATIRKSAPEGKTCIVCNGSTFWKTPGLYEQVQKLLKSAQDLPAYEIIKVEDDITLGAATAGL
ncbi:MAG: hexokinase [Treponema sp.]|nr:hexokinase [Treponema sp.]